MLAIYFWKYISIVFRYICKLLRYIRLADISDRSDISEISASCSIQLSYLKLLVISIIN